MWSGLKPEINGREPTIGNHGNEGGVFARVLVFLYIKNVNSNVAMATNIPVEYSILSSDSNTTYTTNQKLLFGFQIFSMYRPIYVPNLALTAFLDNRDWVFILSAVYLKLFAMLYSMGGPTVMTCTNLHSLHGYIRQTTRVISSNYSMGGPTFMTCTNLHSLHGYIRQTTRVISSNLKLGGIENF